MHICYGIVAEDKERHKHKQFDRDWSQRHKDEPRYQILSNKTSNKVIIQQSGEVDLHLI